MEVVTPIVKLYSKILPVYRFGIRFGIPYFPLTVPGVQTLTGSYSRRLSFSESRLNQPDVNKYVVRKNFSDDIRIHSVHNRIQLILSQT